MKRLIGGHCCWVSLFFLIASAFFSCSAFLLRALPPSHPAHQHRHPRTSTPLPFRIQMTSGSNSNDGSIKNNNNATTAATTTQATADILICGGGPTGLLAAIMMSKKFPESHIQVHDRLPMPPSPTDERVWADTSKHYLIGLGGRGITSLEQYGVWSSVVQPFCLSVPGRKDWTPETPDGVETIRTERKYTTQVLARDKLVSILHQFVVENYTPKQIQLVYQSMVRPVDFEYSDNDCPKVLVETAPSHDDSSQTKWTPLIANWVVACDGSARTFANVMEELDRGVTENPFRVVRYDDDNVRVYKTLPFRMPEREWTITTNTSNVGEDIYWNFAVRSPKGRVIFDALPANANGDYVGILLMRGDDEMARPNVDPGVFRTFLQGQIPQFMGLLPEDAIAAAAAQPSSELPKFRSITPRMHQGARTILLGDTAHTVKPFFGMGANSALEDVKIFGECIDASPNNLTQAIWNFSAIRTPDVGTLVQTSRDLDRPGMLGVLYFLIPVILDGIFQKVAPQIFQPNIISLIQNEEYTFQQAVERKQQDRVGQLLIVGGVLSSLATALAGVVGFLQDELLALTIGVVTSTSSTL